MAELDSEARAVGPPVPFVVGVGRSGTTLLRLMLDAHPKLAIPPETYFGAAVVAFEREGTERAVDVILESQLWPDCGLCADEFRRRVDRRSPANVGELLRTFYELYAEKRGKRRWGDKTPHYVESMAVIRDVFPEARFVHIVRDGRDVALSLTPLWFSPGDLTTVAEFWSQTLISARCQARELPADAYKEVKYEDLVREPTATLKELCAYLELDWNPSMLEYHRQAPRRIAVESAERQRNGRTISSQQRIGIHELVGHAPRADRAGRWQKEMSAADRRVFQVVAGDIMETFGYESD
jgi:hypothetical protein